jgi:hypothetical protein
VETTPMSRADWRTPGAYEELRSLDAPGFAWEYLRRNSDFQQDRRKLERTARRGVLNQAEADAFARRWGVRFRKVWPIGKLSPEEQGRHFLWRFWQRLPAPGNVAILFW